MSKTGNPKTMYLNPDTTKNPGPECNLVKPGNISAFAC